MKVRGGGEGWSGGKEDGGEKDVHKIHSNFKPFKSKLFYFIGQVVTSTHGTCPAEKSWMRKRA